jgi:lipopolysaccharide export system protein LptC
MVWYGMPVDLTYLTAQDVRLFHDDLEHCVLTSNSATMQNQDMIYLLKQLRESVEGRMRQRIDDVLEDVQ